MLHKNIRKTHLREKEELMESEKQKLKQKVDKYYEDILRGVRAPRNNLSKP